MAPNTVEIQVNNDAATLKPNKVYKCDHELCDFQCATSKKLREHKRKHDDQVQLFFCSHEGCPYSTAHNGIYLFGMSEQSVIVNILFRPLETA